MSVPRRALLVMNSGPTRTAVSGVLSRAVGGAGHVVTAGDPFEATALYAEAPADLVVASLSGWRARDLGFLSAVRARRAAASVLVLVPARQREMAAAAIAAGADACLSEPVDLEELDAAVRRALARAATDTEPLGAVAELASQVGHAVNNPLQVMTLLLEEAGPADPRDARGLRLRDGLRAEIARVKDAIEVVAAFGRLGKPVVAPVDLGALVAERIERFVRTGLVAPSPPAAASKPIPHRADAPTVALATLEAAADASQVRDAVDAMIRFLAAASGRRPAPLRALARPSTAANRRGVEIAIRAEELRLTAERVAAAVASVLEVDDTTRVPYPGLALPDAVGRAHGGGIVRREGKTSTVVVLRLLGR